MLQLELEGEQTFLLGHSQITIKVDRITNNRSEGKSQELRISLYAFNSSSNEDLSGQLVGSAELGTLEAGQTLNHFEQTTPVIATPEGYFYPALTLEEKSHKSPNGWAIFDICRFDEPIYFGKRIQLNEFKVSESEAHIQITSESVTNNTNTTSNEIRITFLQCEEEYTGGPLNGIKLGESRIESVLHAKQTLQDLSWQFDRDALIGNNKFAVYFLEENTTTGWQIRDYACTAIDTTSRKKAVTLSDEIGSPLEELNELIGLETIKQEMRELESWAAWIQKLKELNHDSNYSKSLHMCFQGSPGTGKTTVARIIGRIFAKYGLLEHATVKEVTRTDLVAGFLGQTALKTEEVLNEAMGGVLFIDEAYSLSEASISGASQDYGKEVISTIIPVMENQRNKLCLIFAGYTDEMQRFLDLNPGMSSRISNTINFPDYTDQELWEIFLLMIKKNKLKLDKNIETGFRQFVQQQRKIQIQGHFGNARFVRNTLEKATQSLAYRVRNIANPGLDTLITVTKEDLVFFTG